jgi:hypothetical protein
VPIYRAARDADYVIPGGQQPSREVLADEAADPCNQ